MTNLNNLQSKLKVIYLSSNTTFLLQPVDQNITNSFKLVYFELTFDVPHRVVAEDEKLEVEQYCWFSILDGVRHIGKA